MSTTETTVGDALSGASIHEQWVSTYRTPEAQGFYEIAFDEITRRLNPQPDAEMLDAGCGSCAKSVLLASRGFRVTATDFSSKALELAAGTIRDRGLSDRITLKQGDLLKLPFKDGEFRAILCWGVPDARASAGGRARRARPSACAGRRARRERRQHALPAGGLRCGGSNACWAGDARASSERRPAWNRWKRRRRASS